LGFSLKLRSDNCFGHCLKYRKDICGTCVILKDFIVPNKF
jgi:hypothetical protein